MSLSLVFFFFNDTATTEIYTLSLHDALPIFRSTRSLAPSDAWARAAARLHTARGRQRPHRRYRPRRVARGVRTTRRVDRKSTRLNSSHANISYAVFCLKKKKN